MVVVDEDGVRVGDGGEEEEGFIEERRPMMVVMGRRDGKSEELVLSSLPGSLSC